MFTTSQGMCCSLQDLVQSPFVQKIFLPSIVHRISTSFSLVCPLGHYCNQNVSKVKIILSIIYFLRSFTLSPNSLLSLQIMHFDSNQFTHEAYWSVCFGHFFKDLENVWSDLSYSLWLREGTRFPFAWFVILISGDLDIFFPICARLIFQQ